MDGVTFVFLADDFGRRDSRELTAAAASAGENDRFDRELSGIQIELRIVDRSDRCSSCQVEAFGVVVVDDVEYGEVDITRRGI